MLMTKISYKLFNLIFVRNVSQKFSEKKLKCNFYFEYSLKSKLTNFVIWNKFNSFHYVRTKNLLIWDTNIQTLSWALSREIQ